MSLELLLSGLYPSKPNNTNSNYQQIPYHFVPSADHVGIKIIEFRTGDNGVELL